MIERANDWLGNHAWWLFGAGLAVGLFVFSVLVIGPAFMLVTK